MDQLLLQHFDEVARYIERQLPASLAAHVTSDDLIQETFAKAVRGISGLRQATPAVLVAWLKAIADHELCDALRTQKAQKRGPGRQIVVGGADPRRSSLADLACLLSDHGDSPSKNLARQEAVRAVQVGLAGLPEPQRDAIRLRYLDGKSVSETAAKMRRTPDAVRGLVHRAKQSLRTALGRSSRWFTKK
jgi:RNA polymerase sigma-70 factor (ECF subfamily)